MYIYILYKPINIIDYKHSRYISTLWDDYNLKTHTTFFQTSLGVVSVSQGDGQIHGSGVSESEFVWSTIGEHNDGRQGLQNSKAVIQGD